MLLPHYVRAKHGETKVNRNFKPKKDFIGMDYGLIIHQAEKDKYIT